MPNSSDSRRSAAPRRFDYSVQQLLALTLIPLVLSSTAPASFAAQPIRPAAAVSAPTFSPVAGTYASAQSVTISSTTSGASIRYTADGSTPSPTVGTVYSSPFAVSVTTTIKAIAYKSGMTNSTVTPAAYTIAVADPTFSPVAGRYTSSQNVAIATTTVGASIRYTTDGSTPSPTVGTLYSAPVAVSGATTTIKAIAYKTGLANSNLVSAPYTIAVADPTLTPGTGSYGPTLTVTIATATSGASLRYTTDGSTPSSTAGTVYSSPISVTSTKTIKAIAYKTGLANSNVVPATYTILTPAATPTFTPGTGTYSSPQTVKIATTTTGASINYTTNGDTPTESVGTPYTSPFLLTQTATVKAIAYKSGMANSSVGTATYTITSPDFTLGAIPSRQQVAQGGTASFTITTTVVNGFNQSVTLSAGTPPSGVTIAFNPPAITGAGGAAMNLSVSGSTTPGSYPLVVTGVGGGLTHTTTVTLVVLAPTFYEAEAAANQLAGGAAVVACSSCSGGSRVDNIGYTSPSANGTLTFNSVNAATSGIYALTVYYTNGDLATRTANISVNGSTSTLSISGNTTGSWTTVNTVSVNVTLAAGNNTIKFFNNSAPAPAIDRISLVNTASCSASTVDVVLVIDRSGSMGGVPIAGVKTAAKAFVDDLQLSSDQIALVSFNSTATTNQTLTHTGSLVKTAIDALTSTGSTAIATGINAASTELASARHNAAAQKVIVLLSDGVDNPASGATATTTAANNAKAAGIRIIAIAEGTANTTFMQSLASSITDYYAAPTSAQMAAVYSSIAVSMCRSPNQPPVVDAGPDQTVVLPAAATLAGAMSDDGVPQGNPLTAAWSVVSGPGTVTFANPNAPATTATFNAVGTYVLKLSASDGQLTSTDTVTVTVAPQVVPVSVAPVTATLYGGQTKQFTANQAVNWSVTGPGAVTQTGLYTAPDPSLITSQQQATVTAKSQADQTKLASATVTLMPEVSISPAAVTLYGGQTKQFTSNQAMNWSVTGPGAVTQTGLYTAPDPSLITSQQQATVTAKSQADQTKLASATVTLMPEVSISMAAVTLYGGQMKQFTSNQPVTWSVAGLGAIDANGLYTAPDPSLITSQQQATVTAKSQADQTKSASAAVTLAPCVWKLSNGYSYQRAIVIDHTKVPNTDQASFPLLFSSTDPLLKTVANGGHLSSASGFDIIFAADAACATKLNHEVETWNGATGQFRAWVQIPTLSHSADTTIYLCYGNPGVTADQSNKTGVWDANYVAVYHLSDGTALSAADSTGKNNAVVVGATATAGQIDGAGQFGYGTDLGTGLKADSTNLTAEAWVNPQFSYYEWIVAYPTIVGAVDNNGVAGWSLFYQTDHWNFYAARTGSGTYAFTPPFNSDAAMGRGTWQHLAGTVSNNAATLYLNGSPIGSGANSRAGSGSSVGSASNLQIGNNPNFTGVDPYWYGSLDEVRISSVARSADWIATEYNNQNSPSTFYTLSGENTGALSIAPPAATLHASETQQFTVTVPPGCNTPINWAAPLGSFGPTGLYAAPSSIATLQTVTVTAASQADPTASASATVTLMPPPVSVVVTPDPVTLLGGQTQQFAASVSNTSNTAVTWKLDPPSAGPIGANGLYTAPLNPPLVQWVHWNSSTNTNPGTVLGMIAVGSETVNVSYSGEIHLAGTQLGGTGQNWWLPVSTFTSASVPNAPPDGDVIALYGTPAVHTISFSRPVTNPVLAILSLGRRGNQLSYTFDAPFTVLSQGPTDAWGGGSLGKTGDNILWGGEGDGVIQFHGSFSSIGWTVQGSEDWNGFRVGLVTASESKVAVTATSQADPTKSGSATVYLVPNPTLTVLAGSPGPYLAGTTQSFTAALKDQSGAPVSGVAVTVGVTGANTAGATATTGADGTASFTYTGAHNGIDTVQATVSLGAVPLSSNSLQAYWVAPLASLSTTPITGSFYASGGSGVFDATSATPVVFKQIFSTLGFHAPAAVVANNTSGVTGATRPFTDIATGVAGGYSGVIPTAAANQPLSAFQAAFTGSLLVTAPGDIAFTVYSDNGFVFGIGNGAVCAGGPSVNPPASGLTLLAQLPVMGAYNQAGAAPTGSAVTVHFPAAGSYPYELDYATTGVGNLVLTLASSANSGQIVPPTGAALLTPAAPVSALVGDTQTLSVNLTDSMGQPVANQDVMLLVTGANEFASLNATTDASGNLAFSYQGRTPGLDSVQATASIAGRATVSNVLTVQWTAQPGPPGPSSGLEVSISSRSFVTLPATLLLTGTVAGSPSGAPILDWSKVSGPGEVAFDQPHQAAANASFSVPGIYVLQLAATDGPRGGSAWVTIAVDRQPSAEFSWIGAPSDGSAVSGLVPITVAPDVVLASGTLSYAPASDAANVHLLNSNTVGWGQIGTLDTSQLPNGEYWIQLAATDRAGRTQTNLALITVVGDYKPGRVTTTVTDLVVPAPGLPIQISRTYDSLVRAASSDFGYGWSLGIKVDLEVLPNHDVTLTINGQRRTFYFTPLTGVDPNLAWVGGILNGFAFVTHYTPEPGLFGSLESGDTGCALDWLQRAGNTFFCFAGAGVFQPLSYVYTDPYGRKYTIGGDGALNSIRDLAGNTLTVTAAGITASNGLSVPFERDTEGRITKITDPLGNEYQYTYTAGDLTSVKYPGVATAARYTYTDHYYTGGTDPRGKALPSTEYYADGRLKSVTDARDQTSRFAYDLATYTTTITNPDTGTVVRVDNAYGQPLTITDALSHTTTNEYNADRTLKSVTDPLGHKTSYTYDTNGNRTSVTNPLNKTSHTAYNAYGEPISTTDELGNIRNFTYDTNFWPQSATDTLGTIVNFHFNANGTMQAKAVGRPLSQATTYTYDAYGNLTSETDPLTRQTQYVYDNLGRRTSMTTPAGATTTYEYDLLSHLKKTTAPLGRVTNYEYDNNGNKTAEIDPNNHRTEFAYDELNRLRLVTYPDSTTSTTTYDVRNNPIDATDQSGHVTHNEYDLAGRLTAVTVAGERWTYTYYDDGRKHTETDPLGHSTTYNYDEAGRLTSVMDAQGHTTQYGYDDAGNQTSVTDANTHTTQQQYDPRRRLRVTTYPDTTTTQYVYDLPGNLTSVTDQAGNVVQYTYDDANQLRSVVQTNHPDPSHNTTAYAYDNGGNRTATTDANTHNTQSTFNVLNQMTTETLAGGALTQTRNYDLAGNLLSLVDFNGNTTTYTYDSLNRLLTKSSGVTFTYTLTGKRATMTDASGTTNYTYDNQDRLTIKQTPQGTLNYTYDTAGNLASMSANGYAVTYTHDELNRLSTVVSGASTTTYAYDSANKLATVTYPNGLSSTFQYDTLNRLRAVNGYTYQLGPTGNRRQVTEPGGRTINWNYDGIYRLTNETITLDPRAGSVSYTLDPVGNRLSQTSTLSGIPSATFAYDNNDRVSTDTYDNNGNTLSSGAHTYTYDSENRLTGMNSGAVTLVYDGDGNRVAKTVRGVTTRYLVADLNPTGYPQVVQELNSGAVTRSYVYGRRRISQTQSGVTSYYGYDGLGSVRTLTDASGTATDTYDYDAWGNIFSSTGNTPNVYLYRGEQYDPDLGLYYLRARYYNSPTGRFLTRDPYASCRCAKCRCAGCGTYSTALQKYLYAAANPVNRIDPNGRQDIVDYTLLLGYVTLATATVVVAVNQEQQTHAVGNLIQAVVEEIKENICWGLYIAETADCGGLYPDDWNYDGCMETAWLNLERCKHNLAPIPYVPSTPR
jgi:RHS repeat-associated protein